MAKWMNGSVIVVGAFAVLGVACSSAPDATESSTDPLAVVGVGPTPTARPTTTPVVYPDESFTAPDASCDLYDYFPVAPGSANGGWTTGTCPGAGSIGPVNTPASFCSIDETFASWQGPNVAELGPNCRAARAMHHVSINISGRGTFEELVPVSPPARGGHVVPGSACTEICFPDVGNGQRCITSTPVYDYVICPWTPDNNLDSWVASEMSLGGNPEKLHVKGYCQSGSTTPSSIKRGAYAVIYEYDPKCTGCFPCE